MPLSDLPLQALAERLDGLLLTPGDDAFDGARRIWNGRLDRTPAAIARCTGPEDVEAALASAREREVPLAIRSGGHDYAGNSVCEGGLVIDLSLIDRIVLDEAERVVRVGPGATWGEIDAVTQEVGLATTGCTVSSVGVAGYTLGGGTGYLSRRFGLALDNLVAAEVVTAAGERVRASEDHNPDFFWGLRGAGANLGVVTSLELALHEVGPEVLAGQIVYPLSDAGRVLRVYREVMRDAPGELMCYPFLLRIPPIPVFPEACHGQVAIDLVVMYSGPSEEGREAIGPLRGIADPILDHVELQAYTLAQRAFDEGMAPGFRWYTRAHYLSEITDDAIDRLLGHVEEMPGAFTVAYFEPLGGAIARVDPTATAFPHRSAAHGFHVLAGWEDPADDERIMSWAREVHADMAAHSTGVYVNLLGEDEEERVPAAYGENWRRLVELKAKWDPENVFRSNHNVEPGG